MRYTNEMIIDKLKLYPEMQEKVKLLRFELNNAVHVSEDDVLASLSYGSSSSEKQSLGNSDSRDKIVKIALSYRSVAEQLNKQVVAEIVRELSEVSSEIERLDYYLSLLSPEHEQIVRLFFFDKKRGLRSKAKRVFLEER